MWRKFKSLEEKNCGDKCKFRIIIVAYLRILLYVSLFLIFNPLSYSVNFFYDSHWIFSVNCRVLPSINKASYHDGDDDDDDDLYYIKMASKLMTCSTSA